MDVIVVDAPDLINIGVPVKYGSFAPAAVEAEERDNEIDRSVKYDVAVDIDPVREFRIEFALQAAA